jgi:UDP-N-acetyl-2-amino-2-deoxyglucuronate dehydrogenase
VAAVTTFALIGAAGYVAPRHMRAMREVGGSLVVAYDPNDSVGVLDSHFPDAHFFVEFERFDRHVDKLRRRGNPVTYVSICSPNYLHDAHCRFALRSGADAICEKPLVLNPWNIDGLADIERDTGRRISTILQLRLHPSIAALRARFAASPRRHHVTLTYIASRGRWYHASWKGEDAKSGGVATNIGVHFFDMLTFVFGAVRRNVAHLREAERAAGFLECERADVRWFLSVDRNDLPAEVQATRTTFRAVTVDGEAIEFSDGFTDLHTRSYQEVLAGRGFGLDEVRPSIEIVSTFRSLPIRPAAGEAHPMVAARQR